MLQDEGLERRGLLSARQAQLSSAKQVLFEKRLRGKLQGKEWSIPRRQDSGPAPLSFAQQGLWFLNQLMPDSPFYNVPLVSRQHGALDVAVLEQALEEIVQRHAALRTTFAIVDEQPVQIVAPAGANPLMVADLSGLPQVEREAKAQQLVMEEVQRPFDLARGPLLRKNLLRLSENEHILILNMHHIITDAWSARVLAYELKTLYDAFLNKKPSPLPELPIQYADFADWQRRWFQGEKLATQLAYWRQQLGGTSFVLELLADHPRPATQSFRGASIPIELSPSLMLAIKELARQTGSNLFVTLLASFNVLLGRYTGQEDILVGIPIAGRHRAEVDGLIGFFVNTLVIRTNLAGDPSFRSLLGRARDTAWEAYAHQDLPFETLVKELLPERDPSRNPLFQAMFDLEDAQAEMPEEQALILDAGEEEGSLTEMDLGLEAESQTAKFDLSLSLTGTGRTIKGAIEFCTDLFDADTIERMAEHWQVLLEGIVANPDARLSDLPLLTPVEREQVLVEWNATAAPHPRERCLHELFEVQVTQTPEAVAVIFDDEHITYGELARRVEWLASYLQGQGVRPEVLVGVCMDRTPEMVAALLAVLKAGGAYVPLDPAYPPARLALILQDTEAVLVLSQRHLLARLPTASAPVVCLDRDWMTRLGDSGGWQFSGVRSENLGYVIYTSGSTGRPKGVGITHRSAVVFIHWAQSVFEPELFRGVLASTSICFDLSIFEMFVPLSCGGTVILAETALQLPDLLAREAVRLVNTVPSAARELVRQGGLPASVRVVNLAGEPLSTSLVQALYQRRGLERVYDLYGPSEDTTYSTYALRQGTGPATIGRPIANTQVYLLDKRLRPVPVGVPGELYLGGQGLARGYLRRSDLTAEKFIPDPYGHEAGARLYKTGDLARWRADGNLEFLGRIDQQVKVRGYRIELGEIEAALGQHPGVREAVVLAREDEPENKQLVAYVVGVAGHALDIQAVRQFLQARLPGYMVPTGYVELAALPLTPNGKLDRRALPAPAGPRHVAEVYAGPRTQVEETLATIWASVLKVGVAEGQRGAGIYDNFFELGGHSLLATQVVSRLRQVFGVEMSLRQFFESPTIAAMAEQIERARQAEAGLAEVFIQPVARDRHMPLSFAQQRLWFLDQMDPGSSSYNIPLALRMQGVLSWGVVEQSLNEIVRRHETLRTTFGVVNDQPVQVIAPYAPRSLSVIDLREMAAAKREVEARRLVAQEGQRPFDLSRGPLFRAMWLQLDEADQVLVTNMHHIISDGWSIDILSYELSSLYEAIAAGAPSPLEALPTQYADFAVWQQGWLQGEVLERQVAYWRRQLSDLPVMSLPTDRPRPPVQTFSGAAQSFCLPAALSGRLKGLSQQEGVTPFMLLLAAFQVLLARHSGQTDIVVGTPIANRNHVEIERLIGFFVNTLVIRGDVSGNPTFREVLKRVRRVTLEAYDHQDAPFEKLVEELQPERDLSRNPLFQVMFMFENIATVQQRRSPMEQSSEPVDIDSEITKFDLTLGMGDTGVTLEGEFEYNTDLFNADTIVRMAEHWQVLLEGIAANPDARLSDLPLLTPSEREQVLVEWNTTAAPYPRERCLHTLFEAQVEASPDAVAVVFEDEHLTYCALNSRANQWAHHLRTLGVGPEILVSICLERSIDMVIGLLGILKAGGAYVPLDLSYPQDRLAFMLEDIRAPVLLTRQGLVTHLPKNTAQVICLDAPEALEADKNSQNPANAVLPENLAYVMYTSGSTGRPKGIGVTHRNVIRLVQNTNYADLSADQISLQLAPATFDASTLEIWGALLNGGRLVILAAPTPSSQELGRAIERFQITTMWLTAGLFHLMVDEQIEKLTSLRQLLAGGDVLSVAHVKRVLESGKAGQLINGYGPTENTTFTCCYPMTDASQVGHTVPIGRPISNTTVYMLDRYLQPVPIGVVGDLYTGGDGLARGYLNQPEWTADRFIPHPFSAEPGARLYKTGDLARYLPDGNIEFLGRTDYQVKIRGFRIELEEIETVLSQCPAVRVAVVVARQDERGDKYLAAYIVADQPQAPTTTALRNLLKDKLPDYMIPSAFVLLDVLPLTPNGKVDRRTLPAPSGTRAAMEKVYVAPRDALELHLLQVWESVLGIQPIGVMDNFFDLGGHSLLAIRLMARMQHKLKQHLPLAALFQNATVERLAVLLRRQGDGHALALDTLVPIQQGDENRRPMFFVHPVGGNVFCYVDLARHLGTGLPFYGLQAQGLDGSKELYSSIEEMSSYYIESIRTVQAQGPYSLGGWSMGGLVAFEMAQQLAAQGQTVDRLTLIDTHVPGEQRLITAENDSELFAAFTVDWGMLNQVQLDLTDLAQIAPKERLACLVQQAQQAGAVPPDIELSQVQYLFDVFKNNLRAIEQYRPQVYRGPITLFKASEPLGEEPLSADLGWSAFAAGGLAIHQVPGNHFSALRAPNVQVLSEQIKSYLPEGEKHATNS